ncbi:UPF0182 family membrane protein [Homoserinibacter sp. YIM 151385]|uniref:UPF0182 family membrane protein n=1 Tax=Homoserinibacter sp. YIM 151385 TaxID=2985506 RepID=UPI0022F1010F|nr:UPF0182 family protein [Homoserinibacter sp. YIM 151385]WBU38158.1 UPF0182 family protein [Homoserinibacter sp. YIM 151385]
MTSTSPTPARNRTRATFAISAAILAVVVILFFTFASLYTDVLWFDQLGFLPVLTTQWIALAVMFLVGFAGMAVPVWLSIEIAFRARPVYAKLNSQLDRYQQVIEPLRRLAMYGIPIVLGLFMGVSTATRWPVVMQWLNKTPFGTADPQFGLDISFYVYDLPFLRGLVAYASAVVLIAGLAAAATIYLYGGVRVSQRDVRVTKPARIQLAVMAAIYLLLQAVSIYLDQFATLTEVGDRITGAAYTAVNAVIPGRLILACAAALVAVLCIVTAVIGRWRLPVIGTALLIVSGLIIGTAYPAIIQRFQVEPSARSLEAEYIDRAITATRDAYDVAEVEEVPYEATVDTEAGALRDDAATTANIRILDPALVTRTFAQLQRVVQYYSFPDHLDVDRYDIDGETQDTVISVRELNQAGQSSRGWVNDTLVYTHGYGVVAAFGNQRSEDGQPVFLQGGIPTNGALGEFEPRVYFGESSPDYSIVGSKDSSGGDIEIDYPSGGGEDEGSAARTTFDGDGGPKLDNVFKRLIYALKFQSEQVVLSDDVTDESQVLYERDPIQRVQKLAPYLTLDSDAYPAVVDGRIQWIVDGYTTSSNYPYSSIQQLSSTITDTYTPEPQYALDDVNYIRNSVKATVDAYDGSVKLYAWDDEDPILKTWQKVFPGGAEIVSRDEMSEDLLAHVRYPADLFKMQRSILETYHVTNAGTFFSGNDAWSTPTDPTQSSADQDRQGAVAQPPYYLTMQTPGTDEPAFTLYSTFIPRTGQSASQSVMRGYLTANADPGDDYGKLTLLKVSGQIAGPGQAQNQFTSDTDVAGQLNILERGGTTVVRGNLLTLPVGGGFLYVQPVYVQSTGETSFPLLRRVLVSFGEDVAFEDTLDLALDTLFGGDSGASAGDGDVEPGDTPAEPGDGDGDGGETPAEPGDGSGGSNTELDAALQEYREALQAREQAYADGDLVAAAQADERMQRAIERAIAASEG